MKIRHISFKTIWYTLRAKKLEKHSTVLKLHFTAKWCRKHSRLKKMNNGRPAHFRDSQVLKWKRRRGSKHSRVFNHSPPNMTHGNCLHALHIIRSSVTLGVISFFAGAFLFCRLCTRLDPQSTIAPFSLPQLFLSSRRLWAYMFEMLLTPRTARLEGLGLFVVAPLSRGETAIREEEGYFLSCCHSPGPVVFCRFPSFSPLHRPARRLVIAVTPRQRPRFWICRLLSSFRHLARVHKRQYLKRL